MEDNWQIRKYSVWHMTDSKGNSIYRALHSNCKPTAAFYIPRLFDKHICVNCGEEAPNYIQFQVDLLNGK